MSNQIIDISVIEQIIEIGTDRELVIITDNKPLNIEVIEQVIQVELCGQPGRTGKGVPEGGSPGQILAKKSSTDYDTEWVENNGSGSTHTHANKETLDKITESGGLPLWNGSAWPGGGGSGVDTSDCTVARTAPPNPYNGKLWLDISDLIIIETPFAGFGFMSADGMSAMIF